MKGEIELKIVEEDNGEKKTKIKDLR